MGLPQGTVRPIEALDPINADNWAKASRTLKMFFKGVHTPWVTADKTTSEGKIVDEGNDQEVMWLIYSKLAPEYQYLGDNVNTAQDLWAKCVGAFEASNMTSRMNVRTIHDPSKSIDLYISAIEDAVTHLDRLGVKPTDSEIADTLLMNLDDSLASTRTTILTAEKEPSLAAIKSQIRNAGPSVPLKPIKKEEDDEDDTLLNPNALAAHAASRAPRTRAPRGIGSGGSSKFHWCSATSHDQCRRCGVAGHISDRCIHDMPSDVKDWVLAGPPGKRGHTTAAYASDSSDDEATRAHLAAGGFPWESDSDGEVDNMGYFTMKA
ncbi:hypothetical protein C8J57DRAFT_1253345 [Mycena rebaudengoi]|nr:hypothetical protein C8J57DRAFT_1253345 [Mycena rebaudengoi]